MVIVRMSGGLGNQLFQYGLAYTIGKRINKPVLLDTSSFTDTAIRRFELADLYNDLQVIDLKYVHTLVEPQNKALRLLSKYAGWARIPKVIEPRHGYVPEIAAINHPVYLKGSFVSYKYFEDVSDEWLGKIQFSELHKSQAMASMEAWKGKNIVCVSVRRGDFLNYSQLNVCNSQYYFDCVQYCRTHLDNPLFLFFSDDIDWVKETFVADDFAYWETKDYAIPMKLYAMMNCNHYIISNSSYSWWGAWLSFSKEKLVCCPAKVFSDDSFPVDDYYPKQWVRIQPR